MTVGSVRILKLTVIEEKKKEIDQIKRGLGVEKRKFV